jgi:hypothetical protein
MLDYTTHSYMHIWLNVYAEAFQSTQLLCAALKLTENRNINHQQICVRHLYRRLQYSSARTLLLNRLHAFVISIMKEMYFRSLGAPQDEIVATFLFSISVVSGHFHVSPAIQTLLNCILFCKISTWQSRIMFRGTLAPSKQFCMSQLDQQKVLLVWERVI